MNGAEIRLFCNKKFGRQVHFKRQQLQLKELVSTKWMNSSFAHDDYLTKC